MVCVFWFKSCLTRFHWHSSLPHTPLVHAAASPAAGAAMHACNRDRGCGTPDHVDEQRACAAAGWRLVIQDVNQGKPGAGALVGLQPTTDQDGLAITRWICGQGEVSLTAWFEPFKKVCPVGVVYRHRRAVQFGLNKGEWFGCSDRFFTN